MGAFVVVLNYDGELGGLSLVYQRLYHLFSLVVLFLFFGCVRIKLYRLIFCLINLILSNLDEMVKIKESLIKK